jgi:hypothetical protein
MMPHDISALSVKKVPRSHKIQCRIGRPEPASIEHTHETPIPHKKIRRNEIPMAHDVKSGWRQLPQLSPHVTQASNVQKALAVPEADFHPVIVIGKVTVLLQL